MAESKDDSELSRLESIGAFSLYRLYPAPAGGKNSDRVVRRSSIRRSLFCTLDAVAVHGIRTAEAIDIDSKKLRYSKRQPI